MADLLLNVVETFLDRAFILSGITEIAILRSGVFENLVALLNPILELLSFDCVGCSTRFIRGFSVFLAVAEGLQLIGHRLQFRADAILLLIDFLSPAVSVSGRAGFIRELLRFVGDLALPPIH